MHDGADGDGFGQGAHLDGKAVSKADRYSYPNLNKYSHGDADEHRYPRAHSYGHTHCH
ncbi:MAG: hypothetical protein ACE5NP_06605 [Anaerolineae bacterium]